MRHACGALVGLLFVAILLQSLAPITRSAPQTDTLVIGEYGVGGSLAPYSSNEPALARMMDMLFNGLVGSDSQGRLTPELAEQWEVSPNGLLLTFHLRHNVVWHDGRPFTAADVEATFRLLGNPGAGSLLRQSLSFVRGVRIIDDHTIRFILKFPVYNPVGRFSWKVLPHNDLLTAVKQGRALAEIPVGTGPYRLEKIVPGESIEFAANVGYFLGAPCLNHIVIRWFHERSALLDAMKTEQLSFIPSLLPGEAAACSEAPHCRVIEGTSHSFTAFALNCGREPLTDRNIRQALAQASDRELIWLTFFKGIGSLISGPFPAGAVTDNRGVSQYEYAPVSARRLLHAAGYAAANDDGIVQKDGRQLQLVIKAVVGDPLAKAISETYQNYLRHIGIDSSLELSDQSAWERAVVQNHEFDIALVTVTLDEAENVQSLVASSALTPAHGANFVQYRSAIVDELSKRYETSASRRQQRECNRQIYQILHEDCPFVFLWSLPTYMAINKLVAPGTIDCAHPLKALWRWELNLPQAEAANGVQEPEQRSRP